MLHANKSSFLIMDLLSLSYFVPNKKQAVNEYLQLMQTMAYDLDVAGAAISEEDLVVHALNGRGNGCTEIIAITEAHDNPLS